MGKAKIAITLDKWSIGDLEKLVEKEICKNRSLAI